ncbi:bifunctional nicotinamidase/pyrazinamidase [Acinetobacter qingfengensis]|uniref:Nicotinamidase n=1 Tax=Acinetobacter qingfengensis TaxID=1262585 RepID=A0A1E7RD89_9GAMM|nr:bifunctional nicotinamidase/pyrazinamidase [Acinetobacter qingfengensis]KAA8732108.1 bifunctional nicotinamidase/pyrazinamidase [Acinetobacter qingfengensis]OEY97187.1 nicotinamidase [Acinetobacter qingfengensis]
MQPDQYSALIVVDVQNGFCPDGNLAVANGDEVVPVINHLALYFNNIIITQDWHPENHISFASNHTDHQPFDQITLDYGTQILWPAHCIQNSYDAQLHPDLSLPTAQLIIRKGFHQHIDSYSAFMEADQKTSTGLAGYLKEREIHTVYITGLATDFCVAWTALDAIKLGFKTYVIEDACRAIDLNGSLNLAWQNMLDAGIERIQSQQIFKV